MGMIVDQFAPKNFNVVVVLKEFLTKLQIYRAIVLFPPTNSLLERQLETFERLQSQLELLDESQFEQDHRAIFEDAYFKLKAEILERLSILRQNLNQSPMSSTQFHTTITQPSLKPHLPTLQLMKFSGNYDEWTEFFNVFCMLVHDNPELSLISKFQYLRSCLIDGAARLIQSLDITPENYNQALEILKSRYNNKRLIFQSHIEKIFKINAHSGPNVNEVRNLIDLVNANLRALQSIASQKQICDGIILHLITSKLDPETQAKWEEEICSSRKEATLSIPDWNDLSKFLERRCKALKILSRLIPSKHLIGSHGRPTSNNKLSTTPRKNLLSSYVTTKQTTSCCFCNSAPAHNAFQCSKFIEMSTHKRFCTVKRLKLCINCLGSNHLASSCPSNNKCQQCQASHHTLLHRDQFSPTTNNQPNTATTETESPVALQIFEENSQIILGTARVKLQAPNGRSIMVRALLDSGSQLHFITQKIAHSLRAPRNKINIKITGIANNSSEAFSNCHLILKSATNEYSTPITAIVIPSITSYQPQTKINISSFHIPGNLKLADEYFYKPGPIDLLIRAGLFYELLMIGQIKNEHLPILQKTVLGWIVTGELNKPNRNDIKSKTKANKSKTFISVTSSNVNSPQQILSNKLTTTMKSKQTSAGLFSFVCLQGSAKLLYTSIDNSSEPFIEEILEKFWKIEQPFYDKIRTTEEEECER